MDLKTPQRNQTHEILPVPSAILGKVTFTFAVLITFFKVKISCRFRILWYRLTVQNMC